MLQFSSRPVLEEPVKKSAILVASILLFSLLTARVMDGLFWGVFSTLVLVFALRSYFLRGEFVLDDEGITIRRGFFSRRHPWSDFRRAIADGRGVFLSPFEKPSKLDAFRGEYLRCPGRQEEVLEFVHGRIRPKEKPQPGRVA